MSSERGIASDGGGLSQLPNPTSHPMGHHQGRESHTCAALCPRRRAQAGCEMTHTTCKKRPAGPSGGQRKTERQMNNDALDRRAGVARCSDEVHCLVHGTSPVEKMRKPLRAIGGLGLDGKSNKPPTETRKTFRTRGAISTIGFVGKHDRETRTAISSMGRNQLPWLSSLSGTYRLVRKNHHCGGHFGRQSNWMAGRDSLSRPRGRRGRPCVWTFPSSPTTHNNRTSWIQDKGIGNRTRSKSKLKRTNAIRRNPAGGLSDDNSLR